MNVEVIATAQQVTEAQVKGKTVIVIDVLRATSVMVTALNNGAKGVVPVLEAKEAFIVKDSTSEAVVLGGERHAEPIDGFDHGNSPLAYSKQVIEDKLLVMTTTNGTLAIHNSLSASELLIASFLNDKAVVDRIKERSDLVLVCSGNNGLYTLEDALCAGRIIYLLQKSVKLRLSDLALSVYALYKAHKDNIPEIAAQGYHYKVLMQKGYQHDLTHCFKSGLYSNVPIWNGQCIVNL
ncbi:2-phosphosulfolactate phosphatase [Carboxylicivirga sp. RSCT41]|uniref:2-phosphosulfolactate phosphatase n=1 Tax=Carboxylicivirga agarovorans TaxID=3417570 RepID=UPI003D35232E